MNQKTTKKKTFQILPSLIVIILGLALLIYMIFVEDEPGLVPFLFIGIGSVWFFMIRRNIRMHQK